MQNAGSEEGSSSQDEKDPYPQEVLYSTAGEGGATVPPAQENSGSEPEVVAYRPVPDISDAATNSVEENVAQVLLTSHLSNLNISEDMEDQEPLLEEEEEEEFVVLDPEHPLIRRQQATLSNQLSKQLERINLALKEKMAMEKGDTSHTQEKGVEMFRIQEQLARLYNKLEDRNQTKTQAEAKHWQAQVQVEAVKSQYSSGTSQDTKAKASVSQLQAEIDSLMLNLVFMQGVSEDLRSNVKTMKNARHKAGVKKTQAEEQKLKQDLYIDRLTKNTERLTQQIAMYEAQASAQAEETQAAKEALFEAKMEMESLMLAQKQLLQQWNSSLLGLRRQDEAFSAMQEALREVKHQVILLDREVEGYKKSTTEEQEQNETLTMQLNWSEMDFATSKKLITQKQSQLEALQAHYSTCLRTLRETERTLARLTKETTTLQAEVNDQRKQREKENAVRLELEDKIMTYMQQKLTRNKAAEHSQRLISKIGKLKNEKISQLRQWENEVVAVGLQSSEIGQHLDSLALPQEALDVKITEYDKLLTSKQATISSFVTLIGQKQAIIVSYNRKISQIAASTGPEDLSPLQIKIEALIAQDEELAANIQCDQQLWMKSQGTLVGLTQDIEANSKKMLKLETEYTGMQQKKIRLESQIKAEHGEQAELEKNETMLRGDLLKLNTLLSENRQLSQTLEQQSTLMETEFLHRHKVAEWEYIDMTMTLEKTQEETERLLNSLVEAERQIMLWEKKIQLLKETRSAVDSDVGQGEIQMMKAEMHRMEVGFNQLMKQQEQLLRESEATVARRETIVLRREAMVHTSHKQTTKGELSRFIQGLQRKIQDTHKHVTECEQVIREIQESQVNLNNRLKQKKQQLIELHGTSYALDPEFGNLHDTKDRNIAHLVALQGQNKKLQGVHEGSYQTSSTSESVEAALQSQMERVHAAIAILHHVCEEFPQHQGALCRLSLALAVRTQALDQETSSV
uniref:Coiled-coil domain containing 40 n=1 Tax=Monopterus albus TaxID=43700 RepID=A0A3Q3KBS7_MONAL|nr:coiled-coil domain-containing protein 40 isoform X1 [Monopterus albus]